MQNQKNRNRSAGKWRINVSMDFLQADLPAAELRIYLILYAHADRKTKEAYPSQETLANEAHISRREVIYSLHSLEEGGYITKTRTGKGRNGVNHYICNVDPATWTEEEQQRLDKIAAENELRAAIETVKKAGFKIVPAKEKGPTNADRQERIDKPNLQNASPKI